MAIKTPATFIPPTNSVPGQGAGVSLYRSLVRNVTNAGDFEINPADAICDLTNPNSGEALNVNVIDSSGGGNDASESINFDSRDLVFLDDATNGLDTLNGWTCVFNEILVPESRTAEPPGAGNDAIAYNPIDGGNTLNLDAQSTPVAPFVMESKVPIKLRGTGIGYVLRTGVFADIGVSSLPATFSFSIAGQPPVERVDWAIDRLDGTGNSGVNIDFTKMQTLVIKFPLDNRGSVYFGFLVEGTIWYAYKCVSENKFSSGFSINSPIRDQAVRNNEILERRVGFFDGNAGFSFISKTDSTSNPGAIVTQAMYDTKAYIVSSSDKKFTLPFTAGNRETSRDVTPGNSPFPLCSVRARPWFDETPPTVGTLQNKTVWTIDQIQLFASGPDLPKACYIKVLYNATLDGTAADFVVLPDNSESRMLQNTISTTVTGGFELFSARILTNQVYDFYAKDIFKNYRNQFAHNRVSETFLPGAFLLDQTITIVAVPMDSTDTLLVSATIIGGEVG